MTPTSTARRDADRLADLLRREHNGLAEFLIALAAFDSRRGWADLGHASLWAFLCRDLGLSAAAAYQRKAAAELIQRFRGIEEPLRDGRLCLSSVAELARVLTPENQVEVLPRFFRLSARQAREVVAELAPRELIPERVVVTHPSSPRSAGQEALLTSEVPRDRPTGGAKAASPGGSPVAAYRPPPAPRAVEPLTADLRRLHITVSRRFLRKLEEARASRGHARPGASDEVILEEALDLLLEREARRRQAATDRPHDDPPASSGGRVPARLRREVWARDGGRCQWPLEAGGICGSTHRLEVDHVVPRARFGATTASNLRLLCGPHNAEAARRVFGERWMARIAKTKPGRRTDDGPARCR
jgi:hypothetical protein